MAHRYQELLVQARERAGDPSLREIATASGVSRTAVSNILNGVNRPSAETLQAIAETLCGDDEAAIAEIMAGRRRLPPRSVVEPESDAIAQALREGLADIAEAIRGLGKTP